MDRCLALLLIGLIFGGGIGFVVAASKGVTLDGHEHAPAQGNADGHADAPAMPGQDHAAPATPLNLANDGKVPDLAVTLLRDPMVGWNLHVTTRNFRFAPDRAGQAHVAGEGHAHVYVNGEKLARLYGNWMHIGALPEGTVTVTVSLNANDHRPYALDGAPITAQVTLSVP